MIVNKALALRRMVGIVGMFLMKVNKVLTSLARAGRAWLARMVENVLRQMKGYAVLERDGSQFKGEAVQAKQYSLRLTFLQSREEWGEMFVSREQVRGDADLL
jgi:hypothetical protein